MAEIEKKTKRYPTDLTDEERARIEPFLPGAAERTFGWMTRWRRLVRDYEERIDCSQAMIHVALGSILLRRIAHQ